MGNQIVYSLMDVNIEFHDIVLTYDVESFRDALAFIKKCGLRTPKPQAFFTVVIGDDQRFYSFNRNGKLERDMMYD